MTDSGFVPLSQLNIGDTLFIHNNIRVKGRKDHETKPSVCVKYHPKAPTKIVHDSKTGRDYLYHRGQVSKFIYEAFMNDMTYDEYIIVLNTKEKKHIDSLRVLPENIHVHHKDEDFNNNDIDNLQLVDPSVHGCLHASDRLRNLSFIVAPTEITSIEEAGIRDTYELKCAYPYNNYIANGIVVHNSGKTTTALQIIADAHKRGYLAAFIDAEHALDLKYATNLGVDRSKLLLSQPDTAEEALGIVDILNASGQFAVIVIDSTAALITKAELEGHIGDSLPGSQARIMSQTMRKLKGTAKQTDTMLLFISQTRDKINVFGFGPKSGATGGNALKFYSSVRLEIKRIGAIKRGEEHIGNRTQIKVVKNKCAAPFQECEVNIIYGKGIDGIQEIVDMGINKKYFIKKGAWKFFRPTIDTPEEEWVTVGNSADAFNSFLEDREDIKELILNDIPIESNKDNELDKEYSTTEEE